MSRADIDAYADLRACSIGAQYAMGGIEFYDKAERRGKLLHRFHPEGQKYFTEDGNPLYKTSVRLGNSEVARRKENCTKALQALSRGEEYHGTRPFTFNIFNWFNQLEI